MNNCMTYLPGCKPSQDLSISIAIKDIEKLKIYSNQCEYDVNVLQYAYSLDGVCWSCFMSYDNMLITTSGLGQDFFVNIRIPGEVMKVEYDGNIVTDYSVSLTTGFNFSYIDASTNTNLYNPYANMTDAIALQQQLNEAVSTVTGIPIYYFRLSPETKSADLTFKEYTLMNVEAVKQIKLIIADGQMPSSRPEFSDWGLDFQTDWECEITKATFATAFGNTAQPMSGDLIYIPMMKRMWMVNEAYDEKNGSLMWTSSTFKVMLIKYQEKGSVDLGNAEDLVSSFVKNKYDDLFGADDRTTQDSGYDGANVTNYAENNLYSVYESDATRKYVTCDTIGITADTPLYYRGTLISNSRYAFNFPSMPTRIIYQKEYCGDEGTAAFIMHSHMVDASIEDPIKHHILKIGSLYINIEQSVNKSVLKLNYDKKAELELKIHTTYIVVLQWSRRMNIVYFAAYEYTHNENIPMYKLTNAHYYFDIDNVSAEYVTKYNPNFSQDKRTSIETFGFDGWITNIKIYDAFVNNISELIQMYPTHQHLMVNDTARRLIDGQGVTLR